MAYTKHTWASGEVINTSKLQAIEDGLATAADIADTANGTSAAAVPASAAGNSSVYIKGSTGTVGGISYSQTNTASTIAQRNGDGTLSVATPTGTAHAATKAYVDAILTGDKVTPDNATAPTTITIPTAGSASLRRLLTGNVTAAFNATPPVSTASFTVTLVLLQDSTGSRTVAWPSGMKWSGGAAPVLSTAANAIDLVTLFWTGNEWLGVLGGKAFA